MASSFEKFHEEIRPLTMLEDAAPPEAEQARYEDAPMSGRLAMITVVAVTLLAVLLLALL